MGGIYENVMQNILTNIGVLLAAVERRRVLYKLELITTSTLHEEK